MGLRPRRRRPRGHRPGRLTFLGDGGWRIVDFWESEDDFRAFAAKARPIFEQTGATPIMPKVQQAVSVVLRGDA
ncbi:hypothetical protein [Streptomyces sp. NPDC003327]